MLVGRADAYSHAAGGRQGDVKEIDMGLQAGKDYAARDIQAAVRGLTDNQELTVTIKDLGEGDAALLVNGTQLSSYPAAKGGRLKWVKGMQDLIQEATGSDSLDWSGS
jgi:hypothetical protein